MPKATRVIKSHSLEDISTPHLKCRVFLHSWDEYIPAGKRRPPFGWRLSSICTSCGTERHDIIGAAGQLVSREYVYPDGYLLSFSLSRADARQAYKHRKGRQVARRGDVVRLISS